MSMISNRVFISYRRDTGKERNGEDNDSDTGKLGYQLANAAYKKLTQRGYDVFFDSGTMSIGNFATQIRKNIQVRPHFILVLTPGTLDRCGQEGDWVKREILYADQYDRRFIFLVHSKFDLDNPIRDEPDSEQETERLKLFLQKFQLLRKSEKTQIVRTADTIPDEAINSITGCLEQAVDINISKELESDVESLKRRVLVCYAHGKNKTQAGYVESAFRKYGFDVKLSEASTRSFAEIVERDVIAMVISNSSVSDLKDTKSFYIRQVLFALENDKEFVPFIFNDFYRAFADFPAELMLLPMMHAYDYDEGNAEEVERIFEKKLTHQLTGRRQSTTAIESQAEDYRQKGWLAYHDDRFSESLEHFKQALRIMGMDSEPAPEADLVGLTRGDENGLVRLTRGLVYFNCANKPHKETMTELPGSAELLSNAINDFRIVAKIRSDLTLPKVFLARSYLQLALLQDTSGESTRSKTATSPIPDYLKHAIHHSEQANQRTEIGNPQAHVIAAIANERLANLQTLPDDALSYHRQSMDSFRALSGEKASSDTDTEKTTSEDPLEKLQLEPQLMVQAYLSRARTHRALEAASDFETIEKEQVENDYREVFQIVEKHDLDFETEVIQEELFDYMTQKNGDLHRSGKVLTSIIRRMTAYEQQRENQIKLRQDILRLARQFNLKELETLLEEQYETGTHAELTSQIGLLAHSYILRSKTAFHQQKFGEGEALLDQAEYLTKINLDPAGAQPYDPELEMLIALNKGPLFFNSHQHLDMAHQYLDRAADIARQINDNLRLYYALVNKVQGYLHFQPEKLYYALYLIDSDLIRDELLTGTNGGQLDRLVENELSTVAKTLKIEVYELRVELLKANILSDIQPEILSSEGQRKEVGSVYSDLLRDIETTDNDHLRDNARIRLWLEVKRDYATQRINTGDYTRVIKELDTPTVKATAKAFHHAGLWRGIRKQLADAYRESKDNQNAVNYYQSIREETPENHPEYTEHSIAIAICEAEMRLNDMAPQVIKNLEALEIEKAIEENNHLQYHVVLAEASTKIGDEDNAQKHKEEGMEKYRQFEENNINTPFHNGLYERLKQI